jgi:N-acetylmuramic acid 6-phosphate etherase
VGGNTALSVDYGMTIGTVDYGMTIGTVDYGMTIGTVDYGMTIGTTGTESINQHSKDLDLLPTFELVQLIAQDQEKAVQAVLQASNQLAKAVDLAALRLSQGGRLLYAGAGTSGRLAYLDSSELTPTFGWSRERAVVVMAGGKSAVFQAAEGAEDDFAIGKADLLALKPTNNDVLIGIAASGGTPYVLGALEAAKESGVLRIALSNNPNTKILEFADVPIVLDTGAEIISGSTRLKAGTAQKIALNTLSSGIMVRLHKVYGNLMVDLQATNIKLVARAIRLTRLATGVTDDMAEAALSQSGWHVKTAIIMLEKHLSAEAAVTLLERCAGNVRLALK